MSKDTRRLTPSGAIAKSPVMSSASHVEMLPVLLNLAEDFFGRANAAAQEIARSMTVEEVKEHHKLVATGLGCLELAMKSTKLFPRLEARLCLRYAGILVDETTNIMEAETALTRGIAVCEKHRFIDLKYSSQFLLMKTLFQRSQKAAFKSIESHISDCTTYKHIHWVYAFRFLKAAFHLQSGTSSDHHALENLRKISEIATKRDDKAIFVVAMLLEGLAHLNSMKDDWITRVQTCIAQASKLQLNDDVHLSQIDVLLLLLDLACSLHQKSPKMTQQKLNALQTRLEELRHSPEWPGISEEMLLPIRRPVNAPLTISNDTRGVLRPGDGTVDFLVMSIIGKQEAYGLAYVFHGIVALHASSTIGRSSTIWAEAVRLLDEKKKSAVVQSLPDALTQADWAKDVVCYAHILVGLQAATLCDWAKAKQCLELVRHARPSAGFHDIMTLYLEGAILQGTGRLREALQIWLNPRFSIDQGSKPKTNSSHIEHGLSILAALNRLWIMFSPEYVDEAAMMEVVDQLRPLCEENSDPEIRAAYNLVLSSTNFKPPRSLPLHQVKGRVQNALNLAQSTSNIHCLSMALNIMRCRLFENIAGEQAMKSAKAARTQATRSGNILWMSVAEGMLAQSLNVFGAVAEGATAQKAGVKLANETYMKMQV